MELSVKAILATLLLAPAYWAFYIGRNYLKARKIGLPIVIDVCTPTNPLWFIFSLKLHRLLESVGLGHVLQYGHFGWQFEVKARPHMEMGSAFIHVTPGKLWLELADPDGMMQVYQSERKGNLSRPREASEMLDVFGPNISTSTGNDWARMRRLAASSFNDTTNRVVWRESARQGRQIIASWLAAGSEGVTSTARDTQTFALNVLLAAGFGKVYDFESDQAEKQRSHQVMDYRRALHLVLQNAILIIAVGPKAVPRLGWFSNKLKTISTALATYQQYMEDMLNEKGHEADNGKAQGNLLATLVRASTIDKQLSRPEVFGNMFVFTFGGHDTTAHSLAFTFVLLSIFPEVQEWMREEIREVFKVADSSTWDIQDFAKLKRTHALQLEVLRLYNPLLGISKQFDRPMELRLDGGKRTVTIPGDVPATLNINGLHTHPQFWGDDALEWRPSRFIEVDDNGEEQIVTMPKGTFLPWSDGARACPGRKFGQVEHVALMASIFRDHKVEPVPEKGETVGQTRKRIQDVIQDSGMVLNIQMKHPERAKLRWTKC